MTAMRKVVVVGTGGLAREFASFFADQVEIVGFTSTATTEHAEFELPGAFYAGDISPAMVGTREAVLAIGDTKVRMRLHARLCAAGFEFPPLVHSSAVVSDRAQLAPGAIIAPGCTVSPHVRLGEMTYVNFNSGVGHDSVIGAFVQIGPGCQLGGFCVVGDGSLVGSGATVLQRVRIGAGCTVASGSVVFGRVPDNATVMGNPAKRLRAFEGT